MQLYHATACICCGGTAPQQLSPAGRVGARRRSQDIVHVGGARIRYHAVNALEGRQAALSNILSNIHLALEPIAQCQDSNTAMQFSGLRRITKTWQSSERRHLRSSAAQMARHVKQTQC